MENLNENIIVVNSFSRDGKYKLSLNKTNIVEGFISYVFDILVYETDERYKVEIGPFNDYYDEKCVRHLCNNIPLGLDKKEVYSKMASVCSHVIPFIPTEYRTMLNKKDNIQSLMEEVIQQNNTIDGLTKEELDLRSMRRALEVQRDSISEAIEEKTKSIGGK